MAVDRARAALAHAIARYVPARIARRGCALLEAAGWRYGPAGERRACPACGSPDLEHLTPLPLHDRGHHTRVGFVTGCRHCGIVFANPMPAAETMARMYSPDGRWGMTHAGEHDEKRPSLRYLAALLAPLEGSIDIRRPAPGSLALDFGCGTGELLDALQDAGWATFGIEPSDKRAFVRHRELTAIPGDGRFLLAIAHHVLEHVSSPLEILRALHGALQPGGVVVISVPRLDALPQHRDFRYCINDRAHTISYTASAMATLLAMAGFTVIDVNTPPDGTASWRALKRLRMLGIKSGVPIVPARPLEAARQALEAWAVAAATSPVPGPRLSVRGEAALLNLSRLR